MAQGELSGTTVLAVLDVLAAADTDTALSVAQIAKRVNGGEGLPMSTLQAALTQLRHAGHVERRKDYSRGTARWVRVYQATDAGREVVSKW